MEIERKFMVKYLPDNLEQYESSNIEQGYLCSKPTVRIRKSDDNYILTYKSKIGIQESQVTTACISNELEAELNEEGYEHLKQKIDHNLVCKKRYRIPLTDKLTAELDIFEKQLTGLTIVEVEFETEEEAASFTAPDWFGADVSADGRYKNNYLAEIEDITQL